MIQQLDEATIRATIEAVESNKRLRDAARQLGISRAALYRRLKRIRKENSTSSSSLTPDSNASGPSLEQSGETASLYCESHDVRTVEDALAKADIDPQLWRVVSSNIASYEVVTSNKDGTATRHPLWRVSVKLQRILPEAQLEALERLSHRIPSQEPLPPPRNSEGIEDLLMEVGLHDIHFGMLAWTRETESDNYDLKRAEHVYLSAVDQALEYAAPFNISKFLLPIGSDFFHANDPSNATPRGKNPLDVDGRMPKVFEAGAMAVINAVLRLREEAPVHLVWIPGNHDPESSYFLALVLKAWFRNDEHVTIDAEPTPRKYIRHGSTLIGITHGHEENHRDLPLIMAQERPEDWAQTMFREWHVGHYHKAKEQRYTAGDTHGGVSVRVLPSLASTDAWHHRKGYVRSIPLAHANLICAERGPLATFTLFPR